MFETKADLRILSNAKNSLFKQFCNSSEVLKQMSNSVKFLLLLLHWYFGCLQLLGKFLGAYHLCFIRVKITMKIV